MSPNLEIALQIAEYYSIGLLSAASLSALIVMNSNSYKSAREYFVHLNDEDLEKEDYRKVLTNRFEYNLEKNQFDRVRCFARGRLDFVSRVGVELARVKEKVDRRNSNYRPTPDILQL